MGMLRCLTCITLLISGTVPALASLLMLGPVDLGMLIYTPHSAEHPERGNGVRMCGVHCGRGRNWAGRMPGRFYGGRRE